MTAKLDLSIGLKAKLQHQSARCLAGSRGASKHLIFSVADIRLPRPSTNPNARTRTTTLAIFCKDGSRGMNWETGNPDYLHISSRVSPRRVGLVPMVLGAPGDWETREQRCLSNLAADHDSNM